MAQSTLAVQAAGREFQLSFRRYQDEHIWAIPYPSTEIFSDRLLLSENRTVADFKAAAHATFESQKGPTRIKPLDVWNQASQREFGKALSVVVQKKSELLRQRYADAQASPNSASYVDVRRACARQGHVQANVDLGTLLLAESNFECIDFFAEAHNLGHPESLLHLSKVLRKSRDVGAMVQVLLLGAHCGSFTCGQALLAIRKHRLRFFEAPECLSALHESRSYGSIQGHTCTLLSFATARAAATKNAAVH
jgi:hypothetical protein